MSDSFWPKINSSLSVPLYRQIVDGVVSKIIDGSYAPGMPLPSLNQMSEILGISKETIYKAYDNLIKIGVISSCHGKGYFINKNSTNPKLNILVLLPEVNPNIMQVIKSLMDKLGTKATVTLRFHNMNPESMKQLIDSGFGKYNYYLIFPHFNIKTLSPEQLTTILKRIPPQKLIVMDRFFPALDNGCGMSYQFISVDIQNCLEKAVESFRNYNRLIASPVYTSLYGVEIEEALRRFCKKNNIPFYISDGNPDALYKGDVFFIYGCSLGKAVVRLAELIESSGLKLGKDVGIICFDDFQINQIVLGGLTTIVTDYEQMGEEAARMILENKMFQHHCSCQIIRRQSF